MGMHLEGVGIWTMFLIEKNDILGIFEAQIMPDWSRALLSEIILQCVNHPCASGFFACDIQEHAHLFSQLVIARTAFDMQWLST